MQTAVQRPTDKTETRNQGSKQFKVGLSLEIPKNANSDAVKFFTSLTNRAIEISKTSDSSFEVVKVPMETGKKVSANLVLQFHMEFRKKQKGGFAGIVKTFDTSTDTKTKFGLIRLDEQKGKLIARTPFGKTDREYRATRLLENMEICFQYVLEKLMADHMNQLN